MSTLFIFEAKYLFILSPIIAAVYFWRADIEIKRNIFKVALYAVPISFVLAKIGSWLYNNPRPFVVDGIAPLIQHTADNGFPSDHVLFVGIIASIIMVFDRKWSVPLWIIALLVAWSRVYVGVHHVLDVVASIVISLVVTLVIYYWSKNKQNAPNNTPTGTVE